MTSHIYRDGALWAGTFAGGAIWYFGGRVTAYTTKEGLPSNTVIRIDQPYGGPFLDRNRHPQKFASEGRRSGRVLVVICVSVLSASRKPPFSLCHQNKIVPA